MVYISLLLYSNKERLINKILSDLNIEAVGFIVVFPHLFPVVQFTCTAHVYCSCALFIKIMLTLRNLENLING